MPAIGSYSIWSLKGELFIYIVVWSTKEPSFHLASFKPIEIALILLNSPKLRQNLNRPTSRRPASLWIDLVAGSAVIKTHIRTGTKCIQIIKV